MTTTLELGESAADPPSQWILSPPPPKPLQQQQQQHSPLLPVLLPSITQSIIDNFHLQQQPASSYQYYRTIATELAQHSPADILYELQHYDPFGVRTVAEQMANTSSLRGDEVSAPGSNSSNNIYDTEIQKLQSIFPCPTSSLYRLSSPDRRNRTQLEYYHQDMQRRRRTITGIDTTTTTAATSFLFFQHLRKAGGTHFCTLAQRNLPKSWVPSYYCMPDYGWVDVDDTKEGSSSSTSTKRQRQKCAGCLHQWTNEEIISRMGPHAIMGNEWDSFDVQNHFTLPAIFVTSFRAPMHRALSQFRFECVEARGCRIKTIEEYWSKRSDLYNIYTHTFSDIPRQGSFATDTTNVESAHRRAESIGTSFDTLLQFHLVLVMEWLSYAHLPVQQVLGFHDTSVLTKPVRPHNTQEHHRTDSWIPESYLSPEQYRIMSETLALDEILYDIARRLFLERLVCNNY
jgi:hypothetical protein